ncbi:hypothetical protein MXE31_17900, partial [Acinetobacter baumannii]|nr:hypothetical protein [Acinetobacter baumannii]MDC4861825.1 hypothetical protein [Acinetobacter baumannii]
VLMTVLSMIFIMILNVHGQRNTLNQVKEEYLDIFDELEKKFEDVDAEIRKIKGEVNDKFDRVMSYIYVAIIICVALGVYTAYLFYQSSIL